MNIEKKIADYLHLYLGCTLLCPLSQSPKTNGVIKLTPEFLQAMYDYPSDAQNCKPMLSKLEDVTDDQWAEIENEIDIFPEARGINMIRDNFMDDRPSNRNGWDTINQTLMQLRKRGVDVDGLIESGLAIDKKTLK